MSKQKKHLCKTIARKKLTKKQLWIVEWLKMNQYIAQVILQG